MKNKRIIIYILLITIIIITISYLSVEITKLFYETKDDTDYQNLGLQIKANNIEYCTKYGYAGFSKYKVYKIKNYYSDSMDTYKNQLESSQLWNREKFYEYIMKEFYEIKENETYKIDRDDLYYYHINNIYAIFDIKNAKLYYFENGIFNQHNDYNEILGIRSNNYKSREIYSVRGGPQNDGTDYYTYQFNENQRKEIVETLEQSSKWSKNKLEDEKLDDFEYNKEVLSIENGYYHYEKICRTSDENKKNNFTDEEATGWEIGIYDVDKNILYYYWTSY